MDLLLDLNGLPTGLPYYLLSCKKGKERKKSENQGSAFQHAVTDISNTAASSRAKQKE